MHATCTDRTPKFLVFVIAMFLVAVAAPAYSCGTYTGKDLRSIERAEKRYLDFADLTVNGVWIENQRREEDGFVRGVVRYSKKDKTIEIPLMFDFEINCGFPGFPSDGERGKFYLRADSISPGDYGAEEFEYSLLHFQREGAKD